MESSSPTTPRTIPKRHVAVRAAKSQITLPQQPGKAEPRQEEAETSVLCVLAWSHKTLRSHVEAP